MLERSFRPSATGSMMRLFSFAATALLIAHNAIAADSYLLRHEFEGGSWDFDMASIAVVDDTLRTSRMTLNLTQPLQDQPTGNRYDRIVFLYEHDCKAQRMRVVDTLSYLRDERVEVKGASPEWRAAADSVAHKYACALVKKPGAQ
jgi:hypothetical protein